MDIKKYRGMVAKMTLSEGMDQRVREKIFHENELTRVKRKKLLKGMCAAAAAFAVVTGICQIKPVRASVNHFITYITFGNEKGTVKKETLSESFLKISGKAPKKDIFTDSVYEAGKLANVNLLDTKEAYRYKGCVKYSPKLSKNDELYGFTVSDNLYATGDLTNRKLIPKETADGSDFLEYTRGKKYKTPILTQITIRTDKNLDKEYKDNELGYTGSMQNLNLSKDNRGEVYLIKNLGVKAVLFTVRTDGPVDWGTDSEDIDCCQAIFVYHGIEYVYAGGIGYDTMKSFLETLQ